MTLNAEKPDLIVLTGDTVKPWHQEDFRSIFMQAVAIF